MKRPIILLLSIAASYTTYCLLTNQFHLALNENSISSLAYAAASTDYVMQVPLFILSVASFNLWTHNNTHISFIDVTSIFWTIIATTLYTVPRNLRMLHAINFAFIAFISAAIATNTDDIIVRYYTENLILLNGVIYPLCTIITASVYGRDRNFIIGTSLAATGYICKLLFIFVGQRWGTAAFHTLSALGIYFLLKLKHKSIMYTKLNNIVLG